MADRPSFLDYNSWSTRTWVTALVAGLVALILFLLFGSGWFWSVLIGILVFLAAAWWVHQEAVPAPTVTSAPDRPAPAPVVPSPVTPATPSATMTTMAPTDPTTGTIETPTTLVGEPIAAAATGAAMADMAAAGSGGVQPAGLAGPREGGADDLKRIKGVGPKLEELLHRLGFYHFDQIAAWTHEELVWVDSHLEGFNGRATRDDWIGQSRILAAGGETEHSQRVDRGEST